MATLDEALYELEQTIRDAEVEGSFMAKVWIGTGLQAAASMVEKKRIELLVEGILEDAEAPVQNYRDEDLADGGTVG